MAGFLDSFFTGGTLPNVNTSAQQSTSYPPWFEEMSRANALKASAIAGEDYQPYGQPRIAGTNADQTSAYNRVRSGIGQYDDYFGDGRDMITSAGGGFNQGAFDTYFNPYMDRVTDRIATLGARNLHENLLPGVNTTFTGAGQHGGSRHADFTARALRDANESIMGQQSNALAQGYDSAMRNYQEGQGRMLAAGKELGTLGTAGQSAYLRDAAALEGVGTSLQGQDQKNLDVMYQDFLNQRDYPRQNVSFLSSVLRGTQVPTSQSTQTTAPAQQSQMAQSPLAQTAGAGIGMYGLGKAFGWFAKGGRVRRSVPKMGRGIGGYARKAGKYADGGPVSDPRDDGRDPPAAPPIFRPDTRRIRKPRGKTPEPVLRPTEHYYDRYPPAGTVFRAHGGPIRGIGSFQRAA